MTEAEMRALVDRIAGQLFVPVEASGRHVHVTREQALALFGQLLDEMEALMQDL